MTDFAAARRMMVDGQVRTQDVTDPRVIAAMLDLPREHFLPAAKAPLAYLDLDLPVGGNGTRVMLKPMVLAKLVHAAGISERDRVLDVGCGSGYSSALLGRLASAVTALEEDEGLARSAQDALSRLGTTNVSVVCGPLPAGWPAAAPYDAIIVQGAVEIAPESLCEQLAEGGRLVCVLRREPAGRAMLYRRVAGDVSGWPIFDAAAPVLPGFARKPEFVF